VRHARGTAQLAGARTPRLNRALDRQALMMLRFHLVLILVVSCMVASACVAKLRPLTWPSSLVPLGVGSPTDDEYEVMYVVLDTHSHDLVSATAYKQSYLLHTETTAEAYDSLAHQMANILELFARTNKCSQPSEELIGRFVALNQERFVHQKSVTLPPGYEFGDQSLPDPNTIYQHELVGVSRVAFSSNRQTALAYAEYFTGISGRGDYFLLRWEENGWKVSCRVSPWVGG
jgi:hypothetical protein